MALSFDPIAFKNTKHILRAAQFLRDLVMRLIITLEHLPGKTMIADIMTKAPLRTIFVGLLKLIDEYASNGVACPA